MQFTNKKRSNNKNCPNLTTTLQMSYISPYRINIFIIFALVFMKHNNKTFQCHIPISTNILQFRHT